MRQKDLVRKSRSWKVKESSGAAVVKWHSERGGKESKRGIQKKGVLSQLTDRSAGQQIGEKANSSTTGQLSANRFQHAGNYEPVKGGRDKKNLTGVVCMHGEKSRSRLKKSEPRPKIKPDRGLLEDLELEKNPKDSFLFGLMSGLGAGGVGLKQQRNWEMTGGGKLTKRP